MYFLLKRHFVLRGWERAPYAVVDTRSGKARFVNKATFEAFELCNGRIDCDLPLIPEVLRRGVRRLAEEGFVDALPKASSIAPDQEYRLCPSRYIRQAHWSVTGRCNYRCKHCYMSAPHAKFGELDHETVMGIVDQLAECGVGSVSLTGGEPLVRSDFLDIVDALLGHGIHITQIYSNGRLVNERLLAALEKRGICPEFNMSYDAPGWHDWLRGVDGAEADVDRAFLLCREHGFPTGAETCLHEHNKHLLRETVNHLASVGCANLKVNPVGDVGEWKARGYGQSLSLDELFDLYLAYIPQYYEDGMPLRIQLGGLFAASPKKPDRYAVPLDRGSCDPARTCVCSHARQVLYISAEGRTLPCMSVSGMDIQQEFPLIPQVGLATCLSDSRYMRFIDTRASEYLDLHPECKACEFCGRCLGGCRASALELNGQTDLMGRDEAACKIFRGGYAARVHEIMEAILTAKEKSWPHLTAANSC